MTHSFQTKGNGRIRNTMDDETISSPHRLPHGNCYAVLPGNFLAGEYPASVAAGSSAVKQKLEAIIRYGVTQFVDLTRESDGLRAYESLARSTAKEIGKKINYHRFPIRDGDIPPDDDVTREILDFIDRCVEDEGCVYLHCWGGIGRTGTIVGCFLVRHGLSSGEALEKVEGFWRSTAKYDPYWSSPENELQKEYVRNWSLKEKLN